MTVFVWAGDLQAAPTGDAGNLARIRKDAFERLVGQTAIASVVIWSGKPIAMTTISPKTSRSRC